MWLVWHTSMHAVGESQFSQQGQLGPKQWQVRSSCGRSGHTAKAGQGTAAAKADMYV